MKITVSMAASLCVSLALCATVMAQDAEPRPEILITNAKIFDGTREKLTDGMSVLVEGNKIAKSITAPTGPTVIDAAGRTMSPGFII